MSNVLLFTQPGCLSCELMRVYLEAREIAFEERDITKDPEAQRTMAEVYKVSETPAVVIDGEVITGFDPARIDQFLESAQSSDAVTES